ncbi:MAG: potassium-transporting ATPase subunit C [Nitrososphaeraceae archaeon]
MKLIRKIKKGISNHDPNINSTYDDCIRNLFRKNLSPSIKVVILMMLVTGISYPLFLIGIGQSILPFQSNGSVITLNGKDAVGSVLIGQEFTSPKFLHIRPAAQTASGVDPHITPEDAFAQAENISRATGIPINVIQTLIELNIERNRIENLIIFAPHYVNVPEVNIELVRQYPEIYAEYISEIGTTNEHSQKVLD